MGQTNTVDPTVLHRDPRTEGSDNRSLTLVDGDGRSCGTKGRR